MQTFTARVPVLLTPEQRSRLERLADERGISVGALVREAIDAYTVPRTGDRLRAMEELFGLEAPVADWETMKSEIERGALGE